MLTGEKLKEEIWLEKEQAGMLTYYIQQLFQDMYIMYMENQMTESRQRMTSLEIAEVTGKPHNDVMKAIRKMEPAWVRICQGKFSLTSRMVQQPNGGTREVPCYSLTKTA